MRQVWLAWAVCLGVLIAGAQLVCPDVQCTTGGFDQAGLGLAHALRGETLDTLMQGVTWLGSLAVLLPLAVLLASLLYRHGRRKESAFILFALLGATALSHLTKLWLMRPRPDLYWTGSLLPADWSYPSAHTLQVSAMALALYLVFGAGRALPLAVSLTMLVGLVGLSRIYLQVHFPSDVLAGLLAGLFWVLGLHAMMISRPLRADRIEATRTIA